MCREGAGTELTVEVTSMKLLQSMMHGFFIIVHNNSYKLINKSTSVKNIYACTFFALRGKNKNIQYSNIFGTS